MTLKTFNLNEKVYKQFSKYCKKEGISMSKRIEKFIQQEIDKINLPLEKPKQQIHPMHKYC